MNNDFTVVDRNEILYTCDITVLLNILEKYIKNINKIDIENLIKVSEEIISFDQINFDDEGTLFYVSRTDSKLIINYCYACIEDYIVFDKCLIADFQKITRCNFKICIYDSITHNIYYASNKDNVCNFYLLKEEELYNRSEYINGLANLSGFKKANGKYADDDMYSLLYEFSNTLLSKSGKGYLLVAPNWF